MKSVIQALAYNGYTVKPISIRKVAGSFNIQSPISLIDLVKKYDYTSVYSKLRASVLSRHFALNKYFRTNVLSTSNVLKTNYSNPEELLSKDSSTQLIERWKINDFESHDDNPLMITGLLLTSLAVEAHLGSQYALRVIKKALFALSTLYKFKGYNFDGYILRGDPVTRIDRWIMEANKKYSARFLIDKTNNYMYCAPIIDPRYKRFVPPAKDRGNDRDYNEWKDWEWYFRRNEPSTDELVGLVAGYSTVFFLVQDQQIRNMVREQVTKLADYLNAHGYMLVRPVGGFSTRGHSGMTPALEYPFNRLFYRITGNSYSSNISFEDVMKKANVWKCLEGPTNWWTIFGISLTVVAPLRLIFEGIGLLSLITTGTPMTPIQLARAWALFDTQICFDATSRGEFAGAYLLMQIGDRIRRFERWMNDISTTAATKDIKPWAVGFVPFIGITGLDDDQTQTVVVKNAYLNWLKARRSFNSTNVSEGDLENWGEKSCFASAIALLLGNGSKEEEEILVSRLKKNREAFRSKYNDDLPLTHDIHYPVVEVANPTPANNEQYVPSPLDYMAGLSLAWLYAKRKAAKGTPVTTKDFPQVPTNLDETLSKAVIPKEIWPHYNPENIDFRIEDIQNTKDIDKTKDAELFTDSAPEKTPVPLPIVLPVIDTNRDPDIDTNRDPNYFTTVKESDKDVYTGITLKNGDIYEFSGITGTIWAGVPLTIGRNGPDGWDDRVDYHVKFPLHGGIDPVNAHPFCLLGKLKNYFFIGRLGRGKERFIYPKSSNIQDIGGRLPDGNIVDDMPLYLRINDDAPGNGDGNFSCRIRVWRDPANK